jgi:hypothetical protein
LFLSIMVVVWAGTLFLQGYLYSEPVEQAYWRAPLAGLILTLFVGYWCSLDYRSPGDYNALFDFNGGREDHQFDKLWSVKKGQEILYTARTAGRGRKEYRDAGGRLWARSDAEGIVEAVIVEDKDGQKVRFEAELTPDGKLFKMEPGQPARYVEVGGQGRVMTDDYIGYVTTRRWGLVVAYIIFNLLHLVAWFLVLWLLMRFQWSHAFGLALVMWLVMTLVLPVLFKKAEDLAKQKATTPGATSSLRGRNLACSITLLPVSSHSTLNSCRGQNVHDVPVLDNVGLAL